MTSVATPLDSASPSIDGAPVDAEVVSDGLARQLPRYRSIAAELARRIATHELPPGSLMPSESELASEFDVTRMTVRQALAGLASQGIIERRHGRGTLVVPIKLQRETGRPAGLGEELEARGLKPGSHVLDFGEVRPSPQDRAALWVGPRGSVFRLRRLRYADGILIGFQETLIPAKFAAGLGAVSFEDESLMRILRERHGLIASYADLEIEAVGADAEVAAILDVDAGTPLLRCSSVTYLEGGRPLERTIGWFLGSRYSYHIDQE